MRGLSAHSITQVLYSCRGEMHAGTGELSQWLLGRVTQRSLLNRGPHPEVDFMFFTNSKSLTFFCIN